MERHEGNLNACYWLKKDNLITILFQLYDVLEKNHGDSLKKSQRLTGVSGEREMNWQNTKGF